MCRRPRLPGRTNANENRSPACCGRAGKIQLPSATRLAVKLIVNPYLGAPAIEPPKDRKSGGLVAWRRSAKRRRRAQGDPTDSAVVRAGAYQLRLLTGADRPRSRIG